MKAINLIILTVLLFLSVDTFSQQKRSKIKKTETVLFDGSSTNAWRDLKSESFPEHGWVVKDGILTVLAKTDEHDGGHDIITKNQYSNFELKLQVRLSEGANSGIKYMVVDTYKGNKNYLGLEYQLIDNERHKDAKLGRNGNRKMAALYDILPTRKSVKINPSGEWNKVKIVSNKKQITHWINGKIALRYMRNSDSYKELVSLSKYSTFENFGGQEKGHILLQGHGNEVSFRNISIKTW
ncbi:DUF1080 domain-containing protein [uncultured Draconibacterium sp.]|uniref:3-keto-disaccharide hydrolase n=1 Tax=uncultured Draconibacterium sp. TaxID=1573823 RepID=UPI0029C91039|nr:DUF1080 domain-containing protein [uncultured Draconibacterium sp.]